MGNGDQDRGPPAGFSTQSRAASILETQTETEEDTHSPSLFLSGERRSPRGPLLLKCRASPFMCTDCLCMSGRQS